MNQPKCITENRKGKHLNLKERETIEWMLWKKFSISDIAEKLGRNESTIEREIERGSVIEYKVNPYISKDPNYPIYIEKKVYYAEEGQRVYDENRKKCGAKNKVAKCIDLIIFVKAKLKSEVRCGPDSALGYARVNNLFPGQNISTKTFYNWIDKGLLDDIDSFDLLHKVGMKPRKTANK
jgi:IS30 family transposase